MNALDAARAVLVAHARVNDAITAGAKRDATPEDLGVALVALDSAIGVLRRALEHELPACCCLHRGHLEQPCQHADCHCVGWHNYDPEHYHLSSRPRLTGKQ